MGFTNAPGLRVSKEQVVEALEEMELSATIRGEALTLEQFADLSDILGKTLIIIVNSICSSVDIRKSLC